MEIKNDPVLIQGLHKLFENAARWKWLILIVLLGCYGLTAIKIFQAKRIYEANTTLLPPISLGEESGAGFMTLAKTFGFGSSVSPQDNSLIYESILKSRLLLGKMMETPFEFNGKDGRNLYQIFGIDGSKDSVKAFAKLISQIKNRLIVNKDETTRMVTVKFVSEDPRFAAGFLNQLVQELVAYFRRIYLESNQEKYIYAKTGLDSASLALAKSSFRLTAFRERNRNISVSESPQIVNQLMELEREMRIDEERFLLFKKETELVKLQMQEGRFTIKVLDKATPAILGKTGRLRILLIGFFLSPLLAFFAVQLAEWLVMLTGPKVTVRHD